MKLFDKEQMDLLVASQTGCTPDQAKAATTALFIFIKQTLQAGGQVNFGNFLWLQGQTVPPRKHKGFGQEFDVPAKFKVIADFDLAPNQATWDKMMADRIKNSSGGYPIPNIQENFAVLEDPEKPNGPMVPKFPADRIEDGESSESIRNKSKNIEPGLQNMIDGLFPDEK